ncbi:MAG: hypothetical protein JW727_06675 [Candidatus Aenigmarchaeota archaeon]|nr:hypothetical protein [Candidatus Aenigmarchaeota archaeon]
MGFAISRLASMILLCQVFAGLALAGGLGIAPSEVHFLNVLRGGYAEVNVTISNPNEVATTVTMVAKGENGDYLTFFSMDQNYIEKPTEVILPSGEVAVAYMKTPGLLLPVSNITIPAKSKADVRIVARPPADVQVGIYRGVITFYSNPHLNESVEGQYGTSIAVALEVPTVIELTGAQNLNFQVTGFNAKNAEMGSPIEFFVSGTNNGNVRATPQVKIEIFDRDMAEIVKVATFNGTEYLPTTKGTDRFEISSENMAEGQYWANITVTLGGKIIANQLLTFDLLEPGTMSRMGELVRIESKVWVNAGEITRVEAIFKNTGELSTSAKFKGEVLLDGEIVEVIESEEMTVPQETTMNLTSYFTPKTPGRYIVNGKVYYSKKVTYPKEVIINVREAEGGGVWSFLSNPTVVLVLLIAVLIAILSRMQ